MHIKKERRCVSCRECKQQNEMLRVTKLDGDFLIDYNHKFGGRGAYVCKCNECINLAIKKRAFNRAFKMNVDEKIYQQLGEYEQNI